MKEFTIVIAEMPAQVLLVSEGPVTLAALERTILVVDHFDVALEIAAPSEPGVAQVTGVRSFVSVSFQVSLQRVGLHYTVTRQAFDPSCLSFADYYGAHLDPALAILFIFIVVLHALLEITLPVVVLVSFLHCKINKHTHTHTHTLSFNRHSALYPR